MDELIANWLTQAPLAVVVLIVAWQIARQITAREQKRDADLAILDGRRVAAQQSAQEAQDRQMERMLDLQAGQQALHVKTNEALATLAAAMTSAESRAQNRQAEVLARLDALENQMTDAVDAIMTQFSSHEENAVTRTNAITDAIEQKIGAVLVELQYLRASLGVEPREVRTSSSSR